MIHLNMVSFQPIVVVKKKEKKKEREKKRRRKKIQPQTKTFPVEKPPILLVLKMLIV